MFKHTLATVITIGLLLSHQVAEAGTRTETPPSTAETQQLISPQISSDNTYPIGQCTWGAKCLAPWIDNGLGNARDWFFNAQSRGFSTGSEPKIGAIIVWEGGEYGHVAVVTAIERSDWIEVLEANVNEIKDIRNFRGFFNPFDTTSGQVLGYIYPPASTAINNNS